MIRVSCLVFRENLKGRTAGAGGQTLQRAPQGREVKLDDFRIAVLMLCRPGRKKKTEGLQYQEVQKNRDS